jgi:hypothetical protein
VTTVSRFREVKTKLSPSRGRRRKRSRRAWPIVVLALAACEVAGIAALVTSYGIAQTTLSNSAEFIWFWLGMFLVELPLVGLISRRRTSNSARTALLVLFGMVTYAPKLLRDPTSPAYHDEFAHWRETYDILATGKLFGPSPIIPIISRYPGLHSATAALVHATGLTIWQAATVLLILFHLTLVLGIAALAEAVGFNSRTSALAAIIYSLNSSFLYFDTQFGYESMAIAVMVWTLVAFVRAIRAGPRQGRAAWCTLTIMLSVGTVVTHHLSAFALILIMALVSIALSTPWLARKEGWARTAGTAWLLTGGTALLAGAWVYFVAPTTLSYLSPYLGQGLSELMQVASGTGSGRQLFGASLSPWWEQKSAYLVVVLALCLAAAGLFLIRGRIRSGRLRPGRPRSLLVAVALWGLIYFPSTVFILSAAGAEGARRSWAFNWIGLSIFVSPVVVRLINWSGRRAHLLLRIVSRAGLMAALAIALVGGVAAGLDASYRFPGPFLYGSDARSVTPELLGTSEWFLNRLGPGHNIVTDRYTGLIFASFGLQDAAAPSQGFPVYDLYLTKPGDPIDPSLLAELSSSDYTYLIVDARMAYEVPQIGVYFEPDEPSQFVLPDGKPIFLGRLNKFNSISWLVKIFQSDDYSIYRINLRPAPAGYQRSAPKFRGKLSVSQ